MVVREVGRRPRTAVSGAGLVSMGTMGTTPRASLAAAAKALAGVRVVATEPAPTVLQ